MLFSWDLDALDDFVDAANAPRANRAPRPPAWLVTLPPNITPATLTNDIVGHLAPHAGGRCDNVMLAPNNIVQYGNLLNVLTGHIEANPFIQRCMRQLPAGAVLASTYVLTDRRVVQSAPSQRAPPAPRHRAVFQ